MNLLVWYRSLMRSVGAALVKLIVTATSGLVSFTTNVIRPVKVTCEFSPVQEGTGDPSPDNVRPISGWTGCEIRHFYQLFDENSETIERKYYTNTGAIKNDDGVITTRIYTQYIPVSPNTMYTIHGDSNDLAYIRVVEFNSIKTFATRSLSSYIQNPSITIRTQSQTRYLRINPDIAVSNICVYETNAATTTTLPITFTDPTTGDQMTVYGGTVTLNEDGSADLVATHYSNVIPPKLQGLDKRADYIGSYRNITGLGFPANVANTIICDKALLRSTQVQPTDGRAVWLYGNTYVRVWVRKDLLSTLDTAGVNEWVANNPLRLCYRRATPITYHFPNVGQLNAFLGTNNIWHNMNGDITVEYWNKQ